MRNLERQALCVRKLQFDGYLPFVCSILWHIIPILIVEQLARRLTSIRAGRDASILTLRSCQRLRDIFDGFVFGTVFRHRCRTFFMI